MGLAEQSRINLERWKASGGPNRWVEAHEFAWNHNDWLSLLKSLWKSEYWPMDPDAVGAVLEDLKRQYAVAAKKGAKLISEVLTRKFSEALDAAEAKEDHSNDFHHTAAEQQEYQRALDETIYAADEDECYRIEHQIVNRIYPRQFLPDGSFKPTPLEVRRKREYDSVPEFVRLLRDPRPELRRRAAFRVGQYAGTDSQEAIESLKSALGDPNMNVRLTACASLGMIGGRHAVSALSEALSFPEPILRWKALDSFRFMADKTARNIVVKALADSDPRVAGEARRALDAIDNSPTTDKGALDPYGNAWQSAQERDRRQAQR